MTSSRADHELVRCLRSYRRRSVRAHGPSAPRQVRVCSGEQCGVAIQVDRPAFLDTLADAFPPRSVAVDVAVLELDACAVIGLSGEADLDLAGQVGVGLDLPGRADVPAEHHPRRWFEGQDTSPVALGAVLAAVVDVATDLALEH